MTVTIRTHYYQQFHADYHRAVPEEGYVGWQIADLPLDWEHTAVVVMHAWDCGSREDYPGWHRAAAYLARSAAICRDVLPPLLAAVRSAGVPLFHVVGMGDYYQDLPGYRRACDLAGPPPEPPPGIEAHPVNAGLKEYQRDHVFPGADNLADIDRGRPHMTFPAPVRPRDDEGVAENAHQLLALCRDADVSHLIYTGFAINWCLLMSPAGMLDMRRRGVLCSAVREGVTAIENRESAATEAHKEEGLWRVSVAFGFVYEVADLLASLDPATR